MMQSVDSIKLQQRLQKKYNAEIARLVEMIYDREYMDNPDRFWEQVEIVGAIVGVKEKTNDQE